MSFTTTVAKLLLIIGGINWTLLGLAHVDLVAFVAGEMTFPCRAIYTLFGMAAVWLLAMMLSNTLLGPEAMRT